MFSKHFTYTVYTINLNHDGVTDQIPHLFKFLTNKYITFTSKVTKVTRLKILQPYNSYFSGLHVGQFLTKPSKIQNDCSPHSMFGNV